MAKLARMLSVACCVALWSAAQAHAEPPTDTRSHVTEAAPTDAAPRVVDLNKASAAELEELPGIGPSRALAILAFREAHGGFTQVGQLMRIKGIGRAMLRKLRPFVTVGTPTATSEPAATGPQANHRLP